MNRKLGRTGITVYPIGFGAMPLSIEGRPPEKDAVRVIHAALDAGITFIDTADVYCLDDSDTGHNERLIQKALQSWKHSDDIIVATKGGCTRPEGRWEVNGRPEHLRQACERSLANLKISAIGLYQLHTPDPKVRFDDSVGELTRLKQEGKIVHIGLSNVAREHLIAALRITLIEAVQNRCNPFYKRDFQNGVIDECAKQGITYIPHSPVGGHFGHVDLAADKLLTRLAARHQTSPYAITLSWLLSKGDHILPIPGASKVTSITDSAAAVRIRLAREEIAEINRLADLF